MRLPAAAFGVLLALVVAAPGSCAPALIDPKSGGEMVPIPAGEFTMGDPGGRADETPHAVRVGPFWMDRYPVTQALYLKVMKKNPAKHKNPRNPVEQTQWVDAARFCNACSLVDGLVPCYDPLTWECDFNASGYRLPTEAEWEYACRAGSRSKYSFGDRPTDLPRHAWLKGNSGGTPHAVGKKAPNAFGLFDMHGNVWEWCNDWYAEDYYSKSSASDPKGPPSGKTRVLRGCAWDSPPEKCRAAYRFKEFPTVTDACFGYDSYGFRRVRGHGTGTAVKPAPAAPVPVPSGPVSGAGGAATASVADGTPSAASRGGTIIFVSDRGGPLDIWKMRADGSIAVNLTNDAAPDADPRFSPDGKLIMFTSLRDGFGEVRTMNRDGSSQKRVTAGSQADWSPDGTRIVFIKDNETYVRELASGVEKRITPEGWERCGVPAWSPDGSHIAVASRHTGDIGIFILDPTGSSSRALRGAEPACTPVWSRDGSRLLCQTVKGHVCEVGASGAGWAQLTFGADVQHYPRYSPDGKTLLFCRAPSTQGPWQIWAVALGDAGTAPVRLTSKGSNFMPDWDAREEDR